MTYSNAVWVDQAELYNQTRPKPPPVLCDILTQLIHTPRPSLVVDLGSGTGLSTVVWGERADRVVGIEPSDEMRALAIVGLESNPFAGHMAYQEGDADRTGLADSSADIVTCGQSFHWMEPAATLSEIGRILRPGGIFAAYDYDWPPTVAWQVEQIFQQVDIRYEQLMRERGLEQPHPLWSKEEHLNRIRASGLFRYVFEFGLHHCEQGNGSRFMGLIMTSGYSFQTKQGIVTEEEIGLDRLRDAARKYIGSDPIPWYFSYRVRLGIR